MRSRAQSGFTLVELMVVLAIMGVASAAVVMSIPGDEEGARADAEQFGARLIAVRDRALFSGRETAALVDTDGYRFEERIGGQWVPIRDAPLDAERWDRNIAVDIGGEGAARIRFDAVGLAEPAAIALTGGTRRLAVNVSAAGNVTIDAGN
jgi:general secretion pathway protein H|tara:strand:- start:3029 stop:3481 length:453 start_codon:yes stop_codon:yes gene_type:complete